MGVRGLFVGVFWGHFNNWQTEQPLPWSCMLQNRASLFCYLLLRLLIVSLAWDLCVMHCTRRAVWLTSGRE